MKSIDSPFSFLSNLFPVHLFEFPVLQDYVIDMFTTENASPTPRLFSLRINLFVSHDAIAPSAFHIEPLRQRNSLPMLTRCQALSIEGSIRSVPGGPFLSGTRLFLWKA